MTVFRSNINVQHFELIINCFNKYISLGYEKIAYFCNTLINISTILVCYIIL